MNHLNYLFYSFICLLGSCLLLNSCSNSIGKRHAQQFCSCSKDFADATVQLKAGTIDKLAYNKIEAEQAACLGTENPLELLKDQPEELAQFKKDFLLELETTCPEIARNIGF